MKTFVQVTVYIAACITGFINDYVLTDDDKLLVGHDWLTLHTPEVGDYLVSNGGGRYSLVRAVDAEDWEEAGSAEPADPGDDQYVITDGTVWMNRKGGKTKALRNAKVFKSESDARKSFLDNEMPDGFSIITLDAPT